MITNLENRTYARSIYNKKLISEKIILKMLVMTCLLRQVLKVKTQNKTKQFPFNLNIYEK